MSLVRVDLFYNIDEKYSTFNKLFETEAMDI